MCRGGTHLVVHEHGTIPDDRNGLAAPGQGSSNYAGGEVAHGPVAGADAKSVRFGEPQFLCGPRKRVASVSHHERVRLVDDRMLDESHQRGHADPGTM